MIDARKNSVNLKLIHNSKGISKTKLGH